MVKYVYIWAILTIFTSSVFSKEEEKPMEKVNKQYSIEIGGRYFIHSTLPSEAKTGFTLLGDYAWKLSGYYKRPSVYLSVPLGINYMLDPSSNHSNVYILMYGWTIRHEFRKDKKFIPYIGYSLLLNQVWIKGRGGRTMGHQTKSEIGLNIYSSKQCYFFKIEYGISSFPSLDEKTSSVFALDLKTGIRW